MAEIERIDERLGLFTELLACQGDYYLWSYSPEGELLSTNCSYLYLDIILRRADGFKEMLSHVRESPMPIIISATFGLLWGAVGERDGQGSLQRVHVLGPAFTQQPSRTEMESFLRGISPAVRRWAPKLVHRLETLPVITFANFCHRIMMLHYCINKEHIQPADITLYTGVIDILRRNGSNPDSEEDISLADKPDRNRVYRAEQMLLSFIREGNLNYKDALSGIASAYNGKQRLAKSALQHAKLSQVIIIALASRAAIEGGVSPEIVYPRQDAYIQDVENARSAPAITEVGIAMLDDYIRLVHSRKENQAFSKAVRSCCDYIEAHMEEQLTIAELARRVGYTDYYLSRKFKSETGMSINDYIKHVRIRRAQILLTTTDLSIQDISDRLGFGARSFFAEVFKQIVGLPPAQWRNENKVL